MTHRVVDYQILHSWRFSSTPKKQIPATICFALDLMASKRKRTDYKNGRRRPELKRSPAYLKSRNNILIKNRPFFKNEGSVEEILD